MRSRDRTEFGVDLRTERGREIDWIKLTVLMRVLLRYPALSSRWRRGISVTWVEISNWIRTAPSTG